VQLLVFPNQLFEKHPGLRLKPSNIAIIEDSLFFGDHHYPAEFHKQKLWLHRATMKRYEQSLQDQGFQTTYADYDRKPGSLKRCLKRLLKNDKSKKFTTIDPVDFILEKRLNAIADELRIEIEFLPNPSFINTATENQEYRAGKNRWFMADFYKWQRKRKQILVDESGDPVGGKWSFDEDNRKKVPKKLLGDIPDILKIKHDDLDQDAKQHVEKNFKANPGTLDELFYPTSHAQAKKWLRHFLKHRLENFGAYEDAIVENESWLWHSVLTPMLNVGLLTPQMVVDETLKFAKKNESPLNSVEGFVRQVIGWREFIRATYEDLGVAMRTTNHWNHHRKLPASFYDGSTGILPVDETIQRLVKTGYCHHIERLMVLGGFMFVCEIDPKDIYRWFMEMFIDSYDWVMVPNVYAMSQNADGGLITTKPYFSGSSYVRKMSHHKKADWCDVWDGLYWRWIWNHVDELGKNPRWAMMCAMAKKMDPAKRETHLENAEAFLAGL
jgi:deoxyribodipyrimidine photolyase-related protein